MLVGDEDDCWDPMTFTRDSHFVTNQFVRLSVLLDRFPISKPNLSAFSLLHLVSKKWVKAIKWPTDNIEPKRKSATHTNIDIDIIYSINSSNKPITTWETQRIAFRLLHFLEPENFFKSNMPLTLLPMDEHLWVSAPRTEWWLPPTRRSPVNWLISPTSTRSNYWHPQVVYVILGLVQIIEFWVCAKIHYTVGWIGTGCRCS